ncbi:MAG: hypothetical protein LC750_00565 [Actinobacteria bacterium]|nr:hypothetical protein [Actinomycetota bacterium]
MWWWIIPPVYLAVAYGTFQFNAYLVRDDVMVRPLIVVRNALLWPIFLPLLIWSAWR